MKLLVLSDSHGTTDEVKEVIDRHKHDIEAIVHCGDSELSAEDKALESVYVVEGNCDRPGEFERDLLFTLDDLNIYVTHGHHYNVKMSHIPLSYRADETGAHLVCFGHTHVATAFQDRNVVFLNPGSLLLPRQRREQTYAIVEVGEGNVHYISFHERTSGERIEELSKSFS